MARPAQGGLRLASGRRGGEVDVVMARAWLRLELRRRWRAPVVLALLIAVSVGTVIGAVAGARRGVTAVDRLLDRTSPATVVAHANQFGFDWAPVRALPEVTALSTYPAYSGFAVDEAPSDPVGAYLPADAQAMRTVERPVILAGRLADPRRADEAVVTQGFVDRYHRGIGSTVTVRLFSAQQVNTGVSGVDADPPPRPAGPAIRARIVGVVRSPRFRDPPADPGLLIPSPGVFSAYPASMGATDPTGYELWALVRLAHGDGDIARFRADLARIVGRTDVEVTAQSEGIQHLRDVARFDAVCLLMFGLAALVAAVVLVGQAVARYSVVQVADLTVLRAPGLTRGQGIAAAVGGPAVAAVAGTAAGLGAAVVVSRWMPFGEAATVEPSPGMDADWLVFGLGGLLTVVLVLAGSVIATRLALVGSTSRQPGRASVVAQSAHRAGLPVPVVVGTRFALEPGAGAGSTRSALSGAVAGVLGVLAAATLSAGVSDASTNPALFGQVHQVETGYGCCGVNVTGIDPQVFRATLTADPDVAGTLDEPFAVAETAHRSLITFSYGPDRGWPGMVLTAGEPPRAGSDVVLAPTTARMLGVGVGSTVTLTGQSGTGATSTATLRVTGLGFVPQTPYNEYDNGAWVAPEGYQALFGGYFVNWDLLIALRRGADPGTVIPRLHQALAAADTSPTVLETMRKAGFGMTQTLFLSRALRPERLQEIRDIRVLPLMLGTFLALLAAGVLGHALTTTTRRRRGDLAALRAVGMTRRQSGMIVLTQATVLAIVGLAIGVPLGIALGRVLWRIVADSTPLAYRPPVTALALALVVPAVFLAINLIAAPAARRAARLRVAEALRSE